MAPAGPALGWPVAGPVTQEYGHNGHPGIDIGVATGTRVHAAGAGTVAAVQGIAASGGYGNLVIVAHPGGWSTYYAHLSEPSVHPGEAVAAGQVIGLSGSTGLSTGPHLHFEVRSNGRTVNPRTQVAGNPSTAVTADPSVMTGTATVDLAGGGGILSGVTDLPGQVTALAGQVGQLLTAAQGIAGFAGKLTEGATWLRVVGFVAGGVIVVSGVALITRDSWAPAARQAAETAAVVA